MSRRIDKKNGELPLTMTIGVDVAQKMVSVKFNRPVDSLSFDLEGALKFQSVFGINLHLLASLGATAPADTPPARI
jgi:hypothetical protein